MKVDEGKLLILWSGRPGSNRRRPAWEYDGRLQIKTMLFLDTSFWR
jgi:hypothetical protein